MDRRCRSRSQKVRLKERVTAPYLVKNKEVKASTLQRSGECRINGAEEAETAARNNYSGDFYRLTRKLAGQGRNMTTIKDKERKRHKNEDGPFDIVKT